MPGRSSISSASRSSFSSWLSVSVAARFHVLAEYTFHSPPVRV